MTSQKISPITWKGLGIIAPNTIHVCKNMYLHNNKAALSLYF